MYRKSKTLSIQDLALLKNNPEQYYQKYPDEKPNIFIPSIKSYSHKPYLAKMPYDRNSRHPLKMCARYMALEEYEETLKGEVDGFNKEFKDAMNLFHDCNEAMEENQSAISYYEGELEKAKQESSKYDKYSIDWDEGMGLYEQKENLLQYAAENVLLDAEVAGTDPAISEISRELEESGFSSDEIYDLMWTDGEGYEDDGAGHFVGLAGDYISQVYDDPLREIESSLKENDGICTPETSQAIDDYITKLEALDIKYEGNAKRRDEAIWELRQLQANNPDEAPSMGSSSDVKKLQQQLDNEWAEWENTKKLRDEAKKEMINSKRKSHERNVALYETANEKQNCKEIFDDAALLGDADNPMPDIDEYIKMIDLKSHVNKDGTLDQKYLNDWDKRMDEGIREYDPDWQGFDNL